MLATRALLVALAFGCGLSSAAGTDRTITEVVKMLQGMLDTSKVDGDTERELYVKYKCYCDTSTEEKSTQIKDLTTDIDLIGSKVDALQGSNGALSAETAKLKAAIAENEQARTEADGLRTKAKEAFDAEEAELTSAISQLGTAVDVLAAIGADQNLQASAEHEKFMAGYGSKDASLLKLRGSMKQALLAAQTFLAPSQRRLITSFLACGERRAPFTATYSAQSGEIVGILTQMRDTFESNLKASRVSETAAVAAHSKFMETKLSEHTTLTASYDTKQGSMGTNDGDLSTKKEQLAKSLVDKASAESFLELLGPQCSDKAKDYDTRKMLRSNEEAAIAKAIAILNSDQAFNAFGNVKATSTGGPAANFVQLGMIHRHGANATNREHDVANGKVLQQVRNVLQPCVGRSRRVRGVLALLQVGNPFERVLAEIAKMHTVIEEEAKLDAKQFGWCEAERTQNDADLASKNTKIDAVQADIESLTTSINDPETGIKKQLTDTEESIESNTKSQKEETNDRRASHKAYVTTVRDTTEAKALLAKAISVLRNYFKAAADEKRKVALEDPLQMIQLTKEEPAPPKTWTGDFAGQGAKTNDAVGLIEFILEETKKEEQASHATEAEDQKMYEDSMATLTEAEEALQTALVSLKKTLAEKKLELEGKYGEHDVTTREKVAIERYLESIKPGCDFITTNYDIREANRGAEKSALTKAHDLISASPSYTTAVTNAKRAALGDCAPLCAGSNATDVKCEACTAGVSVPGYCAGHPDTPGC